MSKPLFTWRHAILESDLPPTTRLVLLTLSCHMNDVGESCFPSVERLSQETGLSNRAVITHLQQARDQGWLKVGLHGFGGQKWRAHEYTCATPEGGERGSPASLEQGGERGSPASPEGGERGSPASPEGGERGAQKVVNVVHTNSTVNSTFQENSTVVGKTPKQQATRRPSIRGTRLPADWTLPAEWRQWAQQEHPGVDVDLEADKFRDYWHAKAGAGATKLDWQATWRNWIRSARPSMAPKPYFDPGGQIAVSSLENW